MTSKSVCLQTLAGQTLDVSVPLESTVDDLKACVSTAWCVPAHQQQLVVGTDILLGFESIGSLVSKGLCSMDNPLLVTVVTRQQPLAVYTQKHLSLLVGMLTSSDSRSRDGAILGLVKLVDAADHRLVDMFVEEVEANCCGCSAPIGVKRAGLQALAKVSPNGHAQSIRAAAGSLEDRREFVWLTAVESVSTLAPRGDVATIAIAKRLLRSRRLQARAAGIMVLGEVALEDTPGVMDLLASFCDHTEEIIRNAGAEAISSIISAD